MGRPLGYWIRGNEKTERQYRSVCVWYVVLQLFDFCAHDVVGFAVFEDIELTIA